MEFKFEINLPTVVLGLATATLSAIVAWLIFRYSGPRIAATTLFGYRGAGGLVTSLEPISVGGKWEPDFIALDVSNRGRAGVSVNSIGLPIIDGKGSLLGYWTRAEAAFGLFGNSFPCKIEAGSSVTFVMPFSVAGMWATTNFVYGAKKDTSLVMRPQLKLGNGKTTRAEPLNLRKLPARAVDKVEAERAYEDVRAHFEAQERQNRV